jgi:hypothetical protein
MLKSMLFSELKIFFKVHLVQNISVFGGGSGQEGTHYSLYTFITHKRQPLCQQFSASQDADSISLALNNSCPRSHFHTGNNATVYTTQRHYHVVQ